MQLTMVRFHPWFSPWIGVVSRVLDQELMCALKEKMQDLMRNTKWKKNAEFPRRVLSRCCAILRACGNKSMSPWRNMRTVQTIMPMKMSILLEQLIKHGAVSVVVQCLWLSNLHAKASVLLVKHWSRKVSLLRCCSLHFVPCLVDLTVKNCRLSQHWQHRPSVTNMCQTEATDPSDHSSSSKHVWLQSLIFCCESVLRLTWLIDQAFELWSMRRWRCDLWMLNLTLCLWRVTMRLRLPCWQRAHPMIHAPSWMVLGVAMRGSQSNAADSKSMWNRSSHDWLSRAICRRNVMIITDQIRQRLLDHLANGFAAI